MPRRQASSRLEADKARSRAEDVIGGKAMLESAILAPFESELGQWSAGYAQFRMPETWRVIVAGDRKHPEWGQAIVQLRELCVMSGYRTEHDPLIESDGEKGRRFWDNYRQEHSGEPDPRPSGLEDIELMKVKLENDRLQRQPVVVEDLRAIQSPQSYMQVPTIPGEYRKT